MGGEGRGRGGGEEKEEGGGGGGRERERKKGRERKEGVVIISWYWKHSATLFIQCPGSLCQKKAIKFVDFPTTHSMGHQAFPFYHQTIGDQNCMIGNLATNALPQLCAQFPLYYIIGHVHIPVVTCNYTLYTTWLGITQCCIISYYTPYLQWIYIEATSL